MRGVNASKAGIGYLGGCRDLESRPEGVVLRPLQKYHIPRTSWLEIQKTTSRHDQTMHSSDSLEEAILVLSDRPNTLTIFRLRPALAKIWNSFEDPALLHSMLSALVEAEPHRLASP